MVYPDRDKSRLPGSPPEELYGYTPLLRDGTRDREVECHRPLCPSAEHPARGEKEPHYLPHKGNRTGAGGPARFADSVQSTRQRMSEPEKKQRLAGWLFVLSVAK